MVLGTVCDHGTRSCSSASPHVVCLSSCTTGTWHWRQQLGRLPVAFGSFIPYCFCTQDSGTLPNKMGKTLPAARGGTELWCLQGGPPVREAGSWQQRASCQHRSSLPGKRLAALSPRALLSPQGLGVPSGSGLHPRPEALQRGSRAAAKRRAVRRSPPPPPPGRELHLAAGQPAPPRPRVPLAAWAAPGRAARSRGAGSPSRLRRLRGRLVPLAAPHGAMQLQWEGEETHPPRPAAAFVTAQPGAPPGPTRSSSGSAGARRREEMEPEGKDRVGVRDKARVGVRVRQRGRAPQSRSAGPRVPGEKFPCGLRCRPLPSPRRRPGAVRGRGERPAVGGGGSAVRGRPLGGPAPGVRGRRAARPARPFPWRRRALSSARGRGGGGGRGAVRGGRSGAAWERRAPFCSSSLRGAALSCRPGRPARSRTFVGARPALSGGAGVRRAAAAYF